MTSFVSRISITGSELLNSCGVISLAAKADLSRLDHFQLLQTKYPTERKVTGMSARQRTKELLKETFPSIWLQWHLMHHPKSADPELLYLDKIVPEGAVTVDVGANCGLYTHKLARLSRRVYAFEPSHKMADLLRRTSPSNVSIHEIALSDQTGNAELFIPQGDQEPVYGLASLEPRLGLSSQQVGLVNVATPA